MKKLLLASAAVVATAGYAAADVAVTGTAFMGISNDLTANDGVDGDDLQLITRVRIIFTASGETDGGLTFGASTRADQFAGNQKSVSGPGGRTVGTNKATVDDGTVYVSGAFGKVTFGDVGSAPDNVIGHVDATSLHDLAGNPQELGYLGNAKTAAKYEYTMDALTFAIAAGQTGSDDFSAAAKYSTDVFSVALGYEQDGDDDDGGPDEDDNQLTLGASTTFSDITLKVVAAQRDSWDETRFAVSAAGSFSGIGWAVFYADHGERLLDTDEDGAADDPSGSAWGLGASYDLGGGASIVGGVKVNEDQDPEFDVGVSMTF